MRFSLLRWEESHEFKRTVFMYQCLKNKSFGNEDGYKLIPIREEDMELIRVWRNAQKNVLRQNQDITPSEQKKYYHSVIAPSFEEKYPTQILFTYLYRDKCIGYGGLVHISWPNKRAEFSYLADPQRLVDPLCYLSDFTHYLQLISKVAFEELQFHRLHGETYSFRQEHIKIMEDFGFRREGTLREHVYKDKTWHNSIMHGLLAGEQYESSISYATEKERKRHHQEKSKKFGILITSVSKKMGLIQAVRTAAEKLGCLDRLYGGDNDPLCIGQYKVDTFWHMQKLNEMNENDILNYCQKHNIRIIFPTRDGELPFFSKHKQFFLKNHIHVMVSDLNTIETCQNKKAFADKLMSNGFLAIPTETSLSETKVPYYVVKECQDAGGKSVHLKLSKEEALKRAKDLKNPIFQPYIVGTEWSVDLYRTQKGDVKGVVARKRDLIQEGESKITTTALFPELEKMCTDIANLLDIKGHAIFQVIESEDGRFWVVECNVRFGGASTASLAVGLDSYYWFLLESMGEDLVKYPFARLEQDIRQIIFPMYQVVPW